MMRAAVSRYVRLWAVALICLASTAVSAEALTVRIGVPDQSAGNKPFIGGPVGMAFMRHQLEQSLQAQGVTVKWQFFKGAGPAVNEALANQQLDFAYLGDLAAIIGRASGLQTRLLLGSRGSDCWLAATQASGIQQITDLKGKRVAVYRGTADQLSFDRTLASKGLSERDMQVINLDWNAAKAALAAGRVDAVWGGVSLLALKSTAINIVARSSDFGLANTTQAGFVGTDAFIQQHPNITQSIINVLVQNAATISDVQQRETWAQEMAQQSQLPADLLLQEMQTNYLNFDTSPRRDPFLLSSFSTSIQQAQQDRLIRKGFDAATWIDGQFVDNALKTLHLEQHWPQYDASGKTQSGS
ncbi:ABC transporter substrate-binding protein [Pantoea sp. A4]|uniref:ABC transporter substrate-binding protein n=1 Tax=Pantoea sp. A4 TaxID=1225184 RepID=UPI00047529C3